MSKQLSEQASELWKTVSAPETAETYQNTLSTTWQILKRLGLTVWLALCLVLVAADWITGTALSSGKSVRAWFENFKNGDSDQLTSMSSDQMIAVGKQSLASAVVKARKQLGLSEETVTPLLSAADASAPKPTAASTPPTTTVSTTDTSTVSTTETTEVATEPVNKA